MFARGFKTWCETVAAQRRRSLGFGSSDPLDPILLANALGAEVHSLDEIPDLDEETRSVLVNDSGSWSAVTLTDGTKHVVILNSAHSAGRSASDLMHELAHMLLGHKAGRIDITEDGTLILNTFDRLQEDEANWLAGCLLLPRDALLRIVRLRLSNDEAARRYGVSVQMLDYRIKVTGVRKQASARTA